MQKASAELVENEIPSMFQVQLQKVKHTSQINSLFSEYAEQLINSLITKQKFWFQN